MGKAAKPKSKIQLISERAKASRKPNEKWTDAIKRSTRELKKEGKI